MVSEESHRGILFIRLDHALVHLSANTHSYGSMEG